MFIRMELESHNIAVDQIPQIMALLSISWIKTKMKIQ